MKESIAILKRTISQNVILGSFILVSCLAPFWIHSQYLTGPIVNASIILTAYFLGTSSAIVVGIFPSTIALLGGILPTSLGFMIPFIILSNAVLAITFVFFGKKSFLKGVALGAISKFMAFQLFGFLILSLVGQEWETSLRAMFGVPQLLTAFFGGLLAFSIVKLTSQKNV